MLAGRIWRRRGRKGTGGAVSSLSVWRHMEEQAFRWTYQRQEAEEGQGAAEGGEGEEGT